MSYLEKKEYRMVPDGSFSVIRNCQGCKGKSIYRNSGNFRVNANGNRIDVWLIYQCEKCKHTYNLTIHERQRPEQIPAKEYEQFLANSRELADQYGTDSSLFARNRAEVNWPDMSYHLEEQVQPETKTEKSETEKSETERPGAESETDRREAEKSKAEYRRESSTEEQIVIKNPGKLHVRADKVVADYLKVSRSQLRQLQQEELIRMQEEKKEHRIEIYRKINIE